MESFDFAMLDFHALRRGEGDDDALAAIILMMLDEEAITERIAILDSNCGDSPVDAACITLKELEAIARLGLNDATVAGHVRLDDLMRYVDQRDSLMRIYRAFTGESVLSEASPSAPHPPEKMNWIASRNFASTLSCDSPQSVDTNHEAIEFSEDGGTILIRLAANDSTTFPFGLGLLRIETTEQTTEDHLLAIWLNPRSRNYQSYFQHHLSPECIVSAKFAAVVASKQLENMPEAVVMIDSLLLSEETERRGLRPIIQRFRDTLNERSS